MPDQPALLDRSRPQSVLAAPLSIQVCRRMVCRQLQNLQSGELVLADDQGTERFGQPGALRATLVVNDLDFYRDLVAGGSLGVGESYVSGKWDSPDIVSLFRLFARDDEALSAVEGGAARLAAPVLALWEWLRRNNRTGSKKNIVAHYDLGNDFYRLMLDPTMSYSCGMFGPEATTLEQASIHKNDHVCKRLELGPQDHLLEIGTGWGGLAIHAATHYGCRVATTTISDEQYRFACDRVRRAGLEDRIEVLNSDYRDLSGEYSKIVSIEMIEAVGHQYYGTYFDTIDRLLSRDGMVLIQAIVINDDRYAEHLRSVDFIQKYIFPGSTIPSISTLLAAAGKAKNMRLYGMEDITDSYGPTLLAWRRNFLQALPQVRELGFSEEFIRMWDYYLCYCAAGFQERYLGDVHLLFARQAATPQPIRFQDSRDQRWAA